ncbi:MAG: 1-deoxy-D-xylulose-5-phosphate reductoisomerase [Oscillospiraceae bacterium]|jgi:1-deoxy-D-xylulose-5-phosphate reductoisomerase|nr:1-deoxy-D-xylulose-5-phosphate reductoisomerase [Oscillospiraceae bacterium]
MTLSLLGSTGSIGRQALAVCEALRTSGPDRGREGTHFLPFEPGIAVLAAGRNTPLLEEQARRFLPELVCVADAEAGRALKSSLADTPVKVLCGAESILEAAVFPGADTVLNALSGISGLRPTLAALDSGKRLLLANKESLVCGGGLVTNAAKRGIIPVDSEHSAIFQCLQGGRREEVSRVILTASGGPFRDFSKEQLRSVTPEMALKHPTWRMGPKVTVDSATLLNKGLEIIEAIHLFSLRPEQTDVVLHPESIIHSMVEYTDGAVIAQLAPPDMRLPIQYALTYPARLPGPAAKLGFTARSTLTFEEPDRGRFPCLALAERAARRGGNMGAALCGAGEAAVTAFLRGECGFTEIAERVERALDDAPYIENPSVEDVLQTVNLYRW